MVTKTTLNQMFRLPSPTYITEELSGNLTPASKSFTALCYKEEDKLRAADGDTLTLNKY